MNFIVNKRWKCFILLPIVFLLLNTLFFSYATSSIHDTLFETKLNEITDYVDMLCETYEAKPNRLTHCGTEFIVAAMEYMDRQYQIYAAVYRYKSEQPALITERFYETSAINPYAYEEFKRAISNNESGRVSITYTPEQQNERVLHIYFRWINVGGETPCRYLLLTVVSKHSDIAQIALWIFVGIWVNIFLTFTIDLLLIIALIATGPDAKPKKRTKPKGRYKNV